jgi:hypothetical protein
MRIFLRIFQERESCFGARTVVDRSETGLTTEYFYGQGGTFTMLVSKVTAPFRASALPFSVVPVVRVMSESARILPLKVEFVPNVAELPTCQKMLCGWAPPARTTELLPKVVSEEAIWNIQMAFAFPPPSRVSAPVMPIVDVDL